MGPGTAEAASSCDTSSSNSIGTIIVNRDVYHRRRYPVAGRPRLHLASASTSPARRTGGIHVNAAFSTSYERLLVGDLPGRPLRSCSSVVAFNFIGDALQVRSEVRLQNRGRPQSDQTGSADRRDELVDGIARRRLQREVAGGDVPGDRQRNAGGAPPRRSAAWAKGQRGPESDSLTAGRATRGARRWMCRPRFSPCDVGSATGIVARGASGSFGVGVGVPSRSHVTGGAQSRPASSGGTSRRSGSRYLTTARSCEMNR